MEPLILQQYAAEADRLLAELRRQVAHQYEIIIGLERARRSSQEAWNLLRQFEASLVLQVADRDRLHRSLGL